MVNCGRHHLGSQKIETVTDGDLGREPGELSRVQDDKSIPWRVSSNRTDILVNSSAEWPSH